MDLCVDGRSDSPGHNAKYGAYSLMDEATQHIIDFSLVQVSEVSSSNGMENDGCQRSLNKKLIPADNFKKYNTKHNPKIRILKPKI